MFTPGLLRLTLAMAAAATLSACGGGGVSVAGLTPARSQGTSVEPAPTNTVTVAPTTGATATPETIAAAGTLVLGSAGLSTVPTGTYVLVETNPDTGPAVSQSLELSFGTVVIVYPANESFATSVVYLQSNPAKYLVGFVSKPTTEPSTYACRSSEWTDAELNELAEASNEPGLLNQPVCTKAITLDATQRTVTYSDVPLVSANNSSDKVVVSATYTWPLPEPEPTVIDTLATSVETAEAP
jgi:hypothetical protein